MIYHVSKRVQREAAKRRDAALERQKRAKERAERNVERGDEALARLQKAAAGAHGDLAAAAEEARRRDAEIEGDQSTD